MTKAQANKLKAAALKRWRDKRRRLAFAKRHRDKILSLSMKGWPRTRAMDNYPAWLELVYEAKRRGIYSPLTSNCDVIAHLRKHAK